MSFPGLSEERNDRVDRDYYSEDISYLSTGCQGFRWGTCVICCVDWYYAEPIWRHWLAKPTWLSPWVGKTPFRIILDCFTWCFGWQQCSNFSLDISLLNCLSFLKNRRILTFSNFKVLPGPAFLHKEGHNIPRNSMIWDCACCKHRPMGGFKYTSTATFPSFLLLLSWLFYNKCWYACLVFFHHICSIYLKQAAPSGGMGLSGLIGVRNSP